MKALSNTLRLLIAVSLTLAWLGTVSASPSLSFGRRIALLHSTSANWAGYAIETNLTKPAKNAVSDVSGQWTVPTLNCTRATTYSSAWVGLDGYSSNSVEQLGTEQDCYRGQPQYSAWIEMYPRPSRSLNVRVKAGDVIKASVHYAGNYRYVLSLADLTTGSSFSTSDYAIADRSSAEWIVEAPSSWFGELPLANFSPINFTNAQTTVNGVTGSISGSWQNDPLTMIDGGAKAVPSALLAGGQNFNVSRAN